MKTSSKIAIAAAAIGAWLFAKKKGVAGVGSVSLHEIDLRDLVSLCNEIADRLQTNFKQIDYPQYRYSDLVFYTDPFGGTYVCLHYDYNTGEIVNWYGEDYAILINSQEQLEQLIERELYRELKGRYGEMYAAAHFDFLKRNNRIGKVDYSNFEEARVISTNGGRAIEFTIYGGDKGKYVTVNLVYRNKMYPKNGLEWEYLSTIGEYKTLSGAIKAAKKYWDRQGVEYNPTDFEKL